MKKTCPISGREFEWRKKDLEFYERMGVPVPDIHPDEMLRKLMAMRNEWKLYRRKCDKTGDTIISAYHENTPFPVYKNEIWWGDSWDGVEYGQDFDKTKSFFEQFVTLRNKVPREGTSVFKSENCDYNGHTRECKNCYLMGLAVGNEDCYYAYWVVGNKDIIDCRLVNHSELCYECINCDTCFDCVMLQEGMNCNECYFSYQLRGCDHCIGCSNLANKSYYVFNKSVTKEEFKKKKKEILDGSYKTWEHGMKYFHDMWDKALHRYVHSLKCENCEGDVLFNSKNCFHSFEVIDGEDCAYNVSAGNAKDVYNSHSAGWPKCELVYGGSVTRGGTDIRMCYYTWFCNDITYCDSCVSCKHCFGCVGLKHKEYCLFNKQYSKKEYEVLRDEIIEHMKSTHGSESGAGPEWGTIPFEMSTFGYNETAANDYFPLTKEEALKMGFAWYDDPTSEPNITPIEIPDSIHDTNDSICDQPILCPITKRPYKIQKGELKFYRKMNLPIPRLSPEGRREKRTWRINPYQLFERECSVCKKNVLSSFSKDRSEKIGCEKCYLGSAS